MFIGREKELRQLNAELSSWKRKTAVLVYGKRRVGKSTLLNEAAKECSCTVRKQATENKR